MITEIPVSTGSTKTVNEEHDHDAITSLHRQALLHTATAEDNTPCLMLNGKKVGCSTALEIADECTLLKQVSLVKDQTGKGFGRIKKGESAISVFEDPGIEPPKSHGRILTVAGLWNIHRMRKQRVPRRFL
ncbi:MAG: hypothetical protein WAR78_08860 [Ferruginibacter sp.]